MERKLYKAAAEGDATSLLDLLKEDPLILDRCMVWSYNETLLHIAAMLGHEKFVDEILDRKPKLAGELDSHKFSALHLATAKGYVGVVKKLLVVNADMCYARDRYGRNPLHIAAVKGRVDVLKELVQESPDAACQKMRHGETILHLCVKRNNLEVLKLLVEFVGDPEFVNLKNDDGDTILHQAAADKQTETISFLTSCTAVEVNSLNADSLTARDLLAQSGEPGRHMDIINNFCEAGVTTAIGRALPRIEMEPVTMRALPPNANDKQDDWLKRKKSVLMVVASLTATMAFQVGVNPPGGFWQETSDNSTNPHTAGFSIMADNDWGAYSVFLVINTLGFLASLSIILLLMSGFPLTSKVFMWFMIVILWIAITSIAFTYSISITAFSPPHEEDSIYWTVRFLIRMWSGLMALIIVSRTRRLMLKTIRNLNKLVTQGRSSASVVMRQDSV